MHPVSLSAPLQHRDHICAPGRRVNRPWLTFGDDLEFACQPSKEVADCLCRYDSLSCTQNQALQM